MGVISTVIALVVCFSLASFLAVYFYGRFARKAVGEPSHVLPAQEDETELDRAIVPMLAANSGLNGLRLVASNVEAFIARVMTARHAGRSLDLQYYYWKDDLTGGLLAYEVIKAADRGVRVRLLLDDINASQHDKAYLALCRHDNIEVRLFNPGLNRNGPIRRGLEMVLRPWSATRRMHNKAWIADNRVAIVGGRNIGDAYFDASEASNFRDLDMVMVGPVVDETSHMFDTFWNSGVVLPITALGRARRNRLPKLRKKLKKLVAGPAARPYLDFLRAEHVDQKLMSGDGLHWTDKARIVFDPPEKAHVEQPENWILQDLLPVLKAATSELQIISPYFIPGPIGTEEFAELVANGVDVSVLTNSLAATDVAAVHGAYSKYRRTLLEDGIKLYELKDMGDPQKLSIFGSKGASLHTKAFTVDGTTAFVGSLNFDPRSAALNTEMGVLFSQQALVEEVRQVFADETSAVNSFQLDLDGGRIVWQDTHEGRGRLSRREPEVGFYRRLTAKVISFLPIESQL
ncbi:phospholipase D family protein [Rhizobium sp. CFBP 8762]|uniref:phospholipase D family protein n=1 Tax=Rhizobium sp. CFBP 8762 TaxID=2775279 RepID=UPI001784DFFE|nr:phospholipase D family protein [Rhizobium sp. CFBP 8762]MBD8552977.1 phospholipase D family protein [Rhizobium sp. CFBP 8762]